MKISKSMPVLEKLNLKSRQSESIKAISYDVQVEKIITESSLDSEFTFESEESEEEKHIEN